MERTMAVPTEPNVIARLVVVRMMVPGVWIAASFTRSLGQHAARLENFGVCATVRASALVVGQRRSIAAHPFGMASATIRLTGTIARFSAMRAGCYRGVSHGTPH